jgi:integrase
VFAKTKGQFLRQLSMHGLNPAYLAKKLGHSVEEFFKTYSKWINSEMDILKINILEEGIEGINASATKNANKNPSDTIRQI